MQIRLLQDKYLILILRRNRSSYGMALIYKLDLKIEYTKD